MFVLHDAVLFLLLVAACKWHQVQIFPPNDSSKIDIRPNSNETSCLMRSDEEISDHSSTSSCSIKPPAFETMRVTTAPSKPVFDYDSMLGDDARAYDKVETSNRSTPEPDTDASLSDFHEKTLQGEAYIPIPPNPFSISDQSSPEGPEKTVALTTLNRFGDVELPSETIDDTTRSSRIGENVQPETQLSHPLGLSNTYNNSKIPSTIEVIPDALTHAFNNFSMKYSTVIFGNYENIVAYPISMADLVLLSSYGAYICTRKAMNAMLNLSHEVRFNLRNIKSFMNKHSISTDGMLADQKMFITDNVKLARSFSGIARRIFNSGSQQINFDRSEEASKIINDWSANRTRNMITNVVNSDQFNNETDIVLISVASVNCSWLKPFDPNHTKQTEFLVNGSYREVWMMNLETHCRHGILRKLDNSTYVELFIGKTSPESPMRMIIILPRENTSLSNVVSKLIEFNLDDMNVDDKNTLVNISLPKFKISTEINLKDHQETMGIVNIFSDAANFKYITKSRYLKVNDFIQTSVIDVNEGNYHYNTTMRAQINEVNSSKNRKIFHVNRPFIILIANNDIILATAQVVDPTL